MYTKVGSDGYVVAPTRVLGEASTEHSVYIRPGSNCITSHGVYAEIT